jgi:type IV secretory pathway TraG/TraD family ATPase VirD4
MGNSNSYVAHEQFATQIKMTIAMVGSGFLFAAVVWILVLYGYHSSIASDLKSICLPLPLKNGKLLTFDGSGLFSQDQLSKYGGKSANGILSLGDYIVALPDHKDFESIKSRSIPLPDEISDFVFPFGKSILIKLITPFRPDKPISIQIQNQKSIGLFKEKLFTTPTALQNLLPKGKFSFNDFSTQLNGVMAGTLFKAVSKWDNFFPWSFLVFPAFIFLWFVVLKKFSKNKGSDKYLRGAILVPYHIFCEKLDNLKLQHGFTFGELRLPREYETSHFLILGTTGSGKSVLLNQFLEQIINRNEKAIIYDVKGEFLSKHGALDSKNDILFYPFDRRSLQWSVFNEIRHKPDFDMLATALLQPPKESQDKYWYDAARDVFRTGLLWLYQNNKKKNSDIIDFFNQPMPGILEAFNSLPIEERSALKHIDGDSKPAMGIMSTLQACIPFLRYIADQDGPFSFRDFIRDEKDKRHLYLLNIRNYEPIFKPLMTFIIDIMIREVLSLADDREKRIYFIIDEFASLGRLSSVFDFIGMARSKGGSLILANQDLGAIESIYGRPLLKTFYNNLNNKFILRIEDPETSKFLSDAFGEREIIKKMESRSMAPGDFGDRHTISDQDKIEKILLQSQFQDLKDFNCYIKIGKVGITKFKIPVKFYTEKVTPFIINEKSFEIPTKSSHIDVKGLTTISPEDTFTKNNDKKEVLDIEKPISSQESPKPKFKI